MINHKKHILTKMTSIACIFLIISFIYAPPIKAQNDHVKAMWVWDFYKSVSSGELRKQLIQFSLKNSINLLFVGTRGTLSFHHKDYAVLIQDARQNGIRVYALAGEASWALEDNHYYALEHLEQVLDYNTKHPTAKFDGFQYDIEPYTLPGFSDHPDRTNLQFLTLLEQSINLIIEKGDALELDVAVPFWYATGERPRNIKYMGATKPLSHHIIDIVDSISIMAYRDNAVDQIKVSKADVEYASSIRKKAYIGAETNPSNGGSIPDSTTYHNKKTSYMNEQFEAIKQYFRENPGYGGISIHSYDSFKAMQLKEEESNKVLEQKFKILQSARILKGYADGSAGFGRTATRAEVAVIAARIGGYNDSNLYKPVSASFRDVPKEVWSYGWVESAHQMGVMNGQGNDRFVPNSNITVEETLIVMAKVIGLSEADDAVLQGASNWAQGWIQAMINEGLIDKRKDYTKEISRDELVGLVYETYRLMKQN